MRKKKRWQQTSTTTPRDIDGSILSLDQLPTPQQRLSLHRKARLLVALRYGLLSIADLRLQYGIPVSEILEWEASFLNTGARVSCRRDGGPLGRVMRRAAEYLVNRDTKSSE